MKMNRRNALITGTSVAAGIMSTGTPIALAGAAFNRSVTGRTDLVEIVAQQASVCRQFARATDMHGNAMSDLASASLDCADICTATSAILKRRSSLPPALLQACADACERQLSLLVNLPVSQQLPHCEQSARDCANACRSAIA
ncbi:MAG: hypothetical protein R3C59_25590 [Planctomycetaceae bacterium]